MRVDDVEADDVDNSGNKNEFPALSQETEDGPHGLSSLEEVSSQQQWDQFGVPPASRNKS